MAKSAQSGAPYELPHEDEVLEVLRAYGVKRARLFGSAARGELSPTSDINILVDLDGPTDYGLLMRLGEDLEAIVQRNVDVVARVHPLFWPYIEPDLVELAL